jgi:hypothetical protein
MRLPATSRSLRDEVGSMSTAAGQNLSGAAYEQIKRKTFVGLQF